MVLILLKSFSYKYGHRIADMSGIASLKTNNFFLKMGIALLSEICLYAVIKSFAYLSHSAVNSFTSIYLNFLEFQS
jgi:hypothetical protein